MTTTTSTPSPTLTTSQNTVNEKFVAAGSVGFSFDELENSLKHMSPSRVRTAVSELVRMGLVRASGQKMASNHGRRQTIWVAASSL